MSALLARAVRPRTRVVIIGLWLVAVFACFGVQPAGQVLGRGAQRVQLLSPERRRIHPRARGHQAADHGEQAAMVIVYRREGGLTAADRRQIAANVVRLNALRYPQLQRTRGRAFRSSAISRDRTAALVTANITSNGESETIADPVKDARDIVGHGRGRPGDTRDRARRLLGRRDQGLRADQRLADRRRLPARLRPADLHLPEPDPALVPAAHGGLRGDHHARDRLGAHRGRGDRERPVLLDPLGAGARRGHRLRAADRGPLPGGAAKTRGPHRGDDRGAPQRRTGHRRVGCHRDRRPAHAAPWPS